MTIARHISARFELDAATAQELRAQDRQAAIFSPENGLALASVAVATGGPA